MILCNLAEPEQVMKFAKDITSQHPDGVDVLVNNAGILGPIDFDKVGAADMHQSFMYTCLSANCLQCWLLAQ